MTIATASPTGGSGWTTRHGQWRVGPRCGIGSPTSTPVGHWCRSTTTSGSTMAVSSSTPRIRAVADAVPTVGALRVWLRSGGWRHAWHQPGGPALLRMGVGDPGWSRRYNGLCPRYRVVGSLGQDDARFQSSGRDYAGSHSSGRGRSRCPGWLPRTVTAVNRSARPATLFVAEDTSTRPAAGGSVTPNVVPPGHRAGRLPLSREGFDRMGDLREPVPADNAPSPLSTDAPLAGEIRITAGGGPFASCAPYQLRAPPLFEPS